MYLCPCRKCCILRKYFKEVSAKNVSAKEVKNKEKVDLKDVKISSKDLLRCISKIFQIKI